MVRAKGRYVGVIDEGDSMSLDTMKIGKTVRAAVAFVQGKEKRIVQRGTSYWKDEAPKGLQARADKMAVKWQSYLDRTGKRFELLNDAKVAKKRAADKVVADRNRRARDKANDLAELLSKIVGHWDFTVLLEKETTGDRLVQSARAARELLAFIEKGDAK